MTPGVAYLHTASNLDNRDTRQLMAERQNAYGYDELLACGRGELFGPGNAQLPLPPMLMFDRITRIDAEGRSDAWRSGASVHPIAALRRRE